MTPKILVLDIETAAATVETFSLFKPMIGISQIIDPVRVICFAYKWHGEGKTHFVAEWHKDGHEAMIRKAHELLDEADFVVGWNSRAFDSKHLKAEMLKYGMQPPSPYKDIDLMLIAKKNFRLMSNKLDWYAQQLGVGAKVSNGGMALWQSLARPKNRQELRDARKLMKKYNLADVDLTDELFTRMRGWIDGVNVGLYVDQDKPSCPNCGGKVNRRGYAYTTARKYRRYRCRECGKWSREANSVSTTDMRGI